MGDVYPRGKAWLALLGLALIFGGAVLAHAIRTSGGIAVRDIRFAGTDGTVMSALLYVPPSATPATPAPGILAVHGYINTREMQDGFAIEFARRGYVVLEMDQTGHGYSGGKAFSNGFGGPDGLRYLRSLAFVDRGQIGLEGHSMGGWTVLAAAAAMPDAYRAIVLEGSSTGAPFAKDGNPGWPRNLGLVYSRYDEFSKLMWGVDRARDVATSAKLQAVFGTPTPIVAGPLYGSIAAGTARTLYQPATTHPGDHISTAAIGDATDWFARTLVGGRPRPPSDQIWFWKEFGTGIGLIGFVLLVLGSFDTLIRTTPFRALRNAGVPISKARDGRWRTGFALATLMPALLFFPTFIAAGLALSASSILPQAITTQVAVWALVCAGTGWSLRRFGPVPRPSPVAWAPSLAIALTTLAIGYTALFAIDRLFHTDLRFWVVALKLPNARQWGIAAIYVVPITLAFIGILGSLRALTVRGGGYTLAATAMAGGFAVMLAIIYGVLLTTGTLVTAFDPLSTVVALQFVPLLVAIAVIATFTWRRTGSHIPGALIVGVLVTLYVCAGTATQG